MGLPRSSLVKSKSTDAPAAASLGAVLPPSTIAVATTVPHLSPVAPPEPQRLGSGDFELEEAPIAGDAPSTQELVRRAALAPMRMAWESIIAPSDPVLDAKMKPQVAERRARFRKVVKATLGGCLALCFVALVVSLVSSSSGEAAAATTAAVGKTVPSSPVAERETLSVTALGKAARHVGIAKAPTRAHHRHARGKHHRR